MNREMNGDIFAKTFCAEEQKFLTNRLEGILGTEGRGHDEECCVWIHADEEEVSWSCDYSVSGYNYCSETEYTKTLRLTVAEEENPEASGYEKLTRVDFGLFCQNSEVLLNAFLLCSKNAWFRGHASEAGYRIRTEAEFLFENL